jgi:hypothetical protein
VFELPCQSPLPDWSTMKIPQTPTPSPTGITMFTQRDGNSAGLLSNSNSFITPEIFVDSTYSDQKIYQVFEYKDGKDRKLCCLFHLFKACDWEVDLSESKKQLVVTFKSLLQDKTIVDILNDTYQLDIGLKAQNC